MGSSVAPPPVTPPPPQQRSFAGPVVLIVLGILFLMGTMGVLHWGMLAHLFARFWPVLLIIWGVIKFLEYQQAQRAGVRPRGIGAGGVFLIIFLVVAGLIAIRCSSALAVSIAGEVPMIASKLNSRPCVPRRNRTSLRSRLVSSAFWTMPLTSSRLNGLFR